MTEFSLLREAPALKPPKATAKPYSRHILGIDSGVHSHTTATPQPHHSHTTATPQPHHSHTKATPKPHQSQLLRLFQRLEGAETACSPRVLAIMRIAAWTLWLPKGHHKATLMRPSYDLKARAEVFWVSRC